MTAHLGSSASSNARPALVCYLIDVMYGRAECVDLCLPIRDQQVVCATFDAGAGIGDSTAPLCPSSAIYSMVPGRETRAKKEDDNSIYDEWYIARP